MRAAARWITPVLLVVGFAVTGRADAEEKGWGEASLVAEGEFGETALAFDSASREVAAWNRRGPPGPADVRVASRKSLGTWGEKRVGPPLASPRLLPLSGGRVLMAGIRLVPPADGTNTPRDRIASVAVGDTSPRFSRLAALGRGSNDAYFLSADVNRRGDGAIAWLRDPLQRGGKGPEVAMVSAWRAGEPPGRPVAVSPPRRSAFAPRVAVGPDGEVLVAWFSLCEDADNVFVRRRSPDGRWGVVRRLGRATGACLEEARLDADIGPGGEAVVAWTGFNDEEQQDENGDPTVEPLTVRVAVRPAAGRFGSPVRVGQSGAVALSDEQGFVVGVGTLRARLTRSGEAVVAWTQPPSPDDLGPEGSTIGTAVVDRRGRPRASQRLGPPGAPAEVIDLEVDRRGRAVLLWHDHRGSRCRCPETLLSAVRPAGGSFGAPSVIAEAAGDERFRSPSLAIDPRTRRATVLWTDQSGIRSAAMRR